MIVKQFANQTITINRFDSGEELNIQPGVEVEVDDQTGDYLISMRSFFYNEETGEQELATDIRQV